MAGSGFGKIFRVTTWGESHGTGVGVVVEGVPAGLELNENEVQAYLNRRKPGATAFSTKRHENDFVTISSGVFDGKTTGSPICMSITNSGMKERPLEETAMVYRPGHADFTYDMKYGLRDYRGGGRSSGRETASRVAAGAVAVAILKQLGISFCTYVRSIGPVSIKYSHATIEAASKSVLNMPDEEATAEALKYLEKAAEEGDSVGGVVEVVVTGTPAGIGEPVFDKLDALLAQAVMSIGAVKGVEFGDGFTVADSKGSENNDVFAYEDGEFYKKTNHSGGVLGGISDGSEIILRAAIKPTPSISKEQDSVDVNGNPSTISAKNPNDVVIVPRAAVVVESMVAITLVDLMFENMSARMDRVVDFYKKK